MIYGFGPRARRVYTVLHDRITRGDWAPGDRLPSHRELATGFGVAPLTVRQVLAQLEAQGLVSRQVGRGTFVSEATSPGILVIGADATMGAFLAEYVRRAGYRAATASTSAEAIALVSHDEAIVLAFCDVEAVSAPAVFDAIRALRTRWQHLPLVAIVSDLADLQALFGTAEWPLHVLPKPVNLGLLDELLRWLPTPPPSMD